MRIGFFSKGIARIPFLSVLLSLEATRLKAWVRAHDVSLIAGWGAKPNTKKAKSYAQRLGLPYVALEDGFVRSYGTGEYFPPLSLIIDNQGIYYNCEQPSALENLLNSGSDLLVGDEVQRAKQRLIHSRLSKYNHAPDLPINLLRSGDLRRVLVVDQTVGDMSVRLGAADSQSFQRMLTAAVNENPDATIYVKTHPEVSSGRKGGYLTHIAEQQRVVLIREPVNPLSLIQMVDRVYVVSSTFGFEALISGKPVSCFGVPWYAGWGVTDDRQQNHPAITRRAKRTRSVDELFAAAYMQYTRYLNPEKRKLGNIFDVINWLERQRAMAQRFGGRMVVVGFRRWKAANVHSMLSVHAGAVFFVKNANEAAALQPRGADCLIFWGRVPPMGLESLANQCGVRLLRMEDGFVRSVGLGSDLIPPQSFVLDSKGIYFDPSQPSELEDLLNTRFFPEEDLKRAAKVRETMVLNGITKYNLEPLQKVQWASQSQGKKIILVPGQVEDDASIRFGCDGANGVHTNQGLLEATRQRYPDAYIVYKPHPDVLSGNRNGRLHRQDALRLVDHVEEHASVVSCIEACDVVSTMTSLTGFDALLRGKQVDVYGKPFYAGWGLTQDSLSIPRRTRCLSLDELVAGALLHYPLYWDPVLKGYTTCEAVLRRIVEERDALVAAGKLDRLRIGYVRRQCRKVKTLWRSIAWGRLSNVWHA